MFKKRTGPQSRDDRQRFASGGNPSAGRRAASPEPGARLKVGRSGPSRLARLSSEELARRLVGHEDEVHQLEAEKRFVDSPPLPRPQASTTKIVSVLQDPTTMTCKVLVEVTSELPAPVHVETLGKPVVVDLLRELMDRQLYSSKTARTPAREQSLGKGAIPVKAVKTDGLDVRVRRHMRTKRRLLIFWVLQYEKRVKALEAQCQLRRAAWLSQLAPIRLLPF